MGSIEKLGQWDVARGLEMTWSDGDVWRAEVDIPQRLVVGNFQAGAYTSSSRVGGSKV